MASGVYVLNTNTGKNLPSETGYYILFVFRYHTSDSACGQIAINLGNGSLYSRNYTSGTWRSWVSCSAKDIETTYIPSGADLNDDKYRKRGFYVSSFSQNTISNLPSYFGGKGAFELTVTGLGDKDTYCTQWLKSHNLNCM